MVKWRDEQFGAINLLYSVCVVLVIFILAFSLVLFARDTYAADNSTTVRNVRILAGTASLTAPELNAQVTFSGDDNNNMTIQVEWGEDEPTDAIFPNAPASVNPANSPYFYAITGLDNSKSYQVRVTVTDSDGGTNSYIINELIPYNSLLHNAVSTASYEKKWAGGWGISNGKYGEFLCQTCHEKRSGNIKRIKKTLIVTDGASSDEFPIQADASPPSSGVAFQDATDGNSDFGDDSVRADNSQSDKICEACHSQNTYHNYDLANNTRNNHKNQSDCIRCHQHNQGFRGGGCNGCHGGGPSGDAANIWPDSSDEGVDNIDSEDDSGEHQVHIEALAQTLYTYNVAQLLSDGQTLDKQKTICTYCHAVNDDDHGSGDDADVFKATVSGTADTVVAKPVWWTDAGDNDNDASYNQSTGTCSLVDCHNNKTTIDNVYDWYAEGDSSCLICHTEDNSNGSAAIDPTSGLHYNASAGGVVVHDGDFSAGNSGTCTSCHTSTPSSGHIDGTASAPDATTYNFQSSAAIDIKLNALDDDTDGSCAADCHSDGGEWYRLWSQDAFGDPTVDITQPLPDNCNVCHGQFGTWAEGTSHAGMNGGTASTMGNTHNSQIPGDNPGAACEDCHVFPTRDDLHENDKITLNDDDETEALAPGDEVDSVYDGTDDVVYCSPCHNTNDLPPTLDSRAYPASTAFTTIERIDGAHIPEGACFSGAAGCHGDTSQRWWPSGDPEADNYPNAVTPMHSADPTPVTNGALNYGYPNRVGSHLQHNITIGELICETRQELPRGGCSITDGNAANDPTDADYNNTCGFCHPMTSVAGTLQATNHVDGVVDLYGGSVFPGADMKGIVTSGDPETDSWTNYDAIGGDGYIYQLDNPASPGTTYPLDTDGKYRQYLYEYRDDSSVNHGTCSQIACHSNSPFTPNWYGDEQAPGQITDLTAYIHAQDPDNLGTEHPDHGTPVLVDDPGTVHLYWTAPGDNGNFSGTAYEYEVYYSTAGVITDANLSSATRAGGATTILRQGEQQEMIVDGLTPDTSYWFAVVTKDQPRYRDTDQDKIYEYFVADGNKSLVGATAAKVAAHTDDVAPIFWGIDQAESHDSGGAVNLSWESARDHTLPITYLVYWTDYALKTHLVNGGALPTLSKPGQYDGGIYSFSYTDNGLGNAPTAGGSDYTIYASTTTSLAYQAIGLESGVLFNFQVKAEDDNGNVDDNNVVSMALPTKMPQESTTTALYLLDGINGLTHQTDPLSPDWSVTDGGGSGDFTFTSTQLDNDISGSTISRAYWVNGISLDLYAVNADKKLAESFDVEFGYNGSNVLGSVNVSIGRRAQRLVRVGLSNLKGEVPADATLYVKIDNLSGGDLTLSWGDDTKKGQLMITAQPVNHQPGAPVIGSLSRGTGGYVDITWTPVSGNDSVSQTMHYDIYGSADNGATWPYVIGLGLSDAESSTGITWDTVGDGLIGGNFNCKVKIEASDGYLFETANNDGSGGDSAGSSYWFSHVASESSVSVDNSTDDEAPAAVYITHEEPRPKQGAVSLHWIAVGNDGYNHGTRAAYYDIRFRKTADGVLNDASWNNAATVQAKGEPVPAFAGTAEEFELLNMTPDTGYFTAIKTCDEEDNCSGLSNVSTITSGQYYCGICHSTPPDEPDTRGTHRQHGYTLEDCAKCHGDGTGPLVDGTYNDITKYDGRHYDGVINIGWAKDAVTGRHLPLAELAPTDSSGVSITQAGGPQIYNDPDGAGGYNSGGPYTATANTDSGSCMNFIAANANGCHGPFEPKWESDTTAVKKEPKCADCHGDDNSTGTRDTDPYDRIWDCNVAGAPSELVKASPPQANHGGLTNTDRYVGAHEVHLNSSFRFAKGDSCRLCHKDTMDLGLHADGNVDVVFDVVANQDDATPATIDQTHGTVGSVGATCGGLSNTYCHDTGANWADPETKCNDCHGMSGLTYDVDLDTTQIGHVMSTVGDVVECTDCHVAGHPQSPDGINPGDPNTLLINNNAAVGINYRSGGIHLKRVYTWGTYTSLAEICWGCHDQGVRDGVLREADGDISEFETNTRTGTGDSPYDFGTLNQASWVGATWESGYPTEFAYKKGLIQSTHTTDPSGTSVVSWDSANGRYNETIDAVLTIRCSNCHDVHNLNLAPGDTMTGIPYLRGTWQTNPYEEDGAPYSTATYVEPQDGINYAFGAVPRGGTGYDQLGGYYIDQNNAVPGTGLDTNPTESRYPTSGWTLESSAGLCTLCHTYNGTGMDQRTGENLWLGPNGHSNSALGGDLSRATNIFDTTHGRPAAVAVVFGSPGPTSTDHMATMVPDMSFLKQGEDSTAGGGYRGAPNYTGNYIPPMTSTASVKNGTVNVPYGFNGYDWGASVDTNSTDYMYHQFSCSKCHNPHASRLPKLMITNCLDIRHNTWDDAKSSLQTKWTSSTLTAVDRNMPAAYYASAQTCHRFDGRRSNATLRGGWNKVTPWTHSNLDDSQHPDIDSGAGQPSEDYNSEDRSGN